MKPCPNCAARVGFRAIALAVSPAWITCPQCKIRLSGHRFVQVLRVAQSLIILTAAIIPWTFYLLLKSGDPDFSISPLAPFLAMVALLSIAWLTRIFLVLRFGRYYAPGVEPRPDPVIPYYLLGTGVLLVLCMVWLIAYAGVNPISRVLLVAWAFALFLVLYPMYGRRLGNRAGKAAVVTLLLLAGILNIFAVVLTVYSIANFPKEPPFQEQLVLSFGPQHEHEAWEQFKILVGTYKTDGTLDPKDEQDREQLLEFLAQNVVSQPEGAFSFDAAPPRVSRMSGLAESELATIAELLDAGNEAAARKSYLRLWKVADNLISGNPITLIQYLIAVGFTDQLVDFYLEGDKQRELSSGGELLRTSAAIRLKLVDAEANAFTAEYFTASNLFSSSPEELCRVFEEDGDFCLFKIPWPFFDVNRSLRSRHDFYLTLVTSSRLPPYERKMPDYEKESDWPIRPSVLHNPVGSSLFGVFIPLISNFVGSKDTLRAKLAVLGYVIETGASGNFDDVPIDPLTGERFVVTDKGDTIAIASSLMKHGEPAVSYEFAKPP